MNKKLSDYMALSELYTQGQYLRTEILVWCPGCDNLHSLTTDLAPGRSGALWRYNRNEDAPTFTPSLMVNKYNGSRCHSYIRDGRWEFLSDSSHPYAGMSVAMVRLPDWAFD